MTSPSNTADTDPDRVRTLATLALLTAALPINLTAVLGSLAAGWLAGLAGRKPHRARPARARTILISGAKMTKALQLARSFHAAGHRVIMAETRKYRLTGHRFSRAVSGFCIIPDPRNPGYAEALLDVVRSEGVDVYLPVSSPVASLYDSLAIPLLSPECEVIHLEPEMLGEVDDKERFAAMAKRLGLRAPQSFRITDARQVTAFDFTNEPRRYILKSIAYDSIRRLDLTLLPLPRTDETRAYVDTLPISAENPWVLQEFIPGREYCTHGTVRDGRLVVHCCCESSPFQINYEAVDEPEILRWVEQFAAGLSGKGQVSLDFIKADDDGEIYAIECNPRTHSAITLFYDHAGLAAAYLGEDNGDLPVQPTRTSRPTYWLYHELWRLLSALRRRSGVADRWRTIRRGKDAVFDWRDPLPFLLLHHLHIPSLLIADLFEGRGWYRIDFNIGKLVQPGGD